MFDDFSFVKLFSFLVCTTFDLARKYCWNKWRRRGTEGIPGPSSFHCALITFPGLNVEVN